MEESNLGQIVEAEILDIVNNKPLGPDQPSRYRLRVKILNGMLAGKITYAAYKTVPRFSKKHILIRLDLPHQPTLESTPEISSDSLVEHEGMRLAGHFLTSCTRTDSKNVSSKDVLMLARFKDWMKSTFVIPNEIEFQANIPISFVSGKTCLGLMSIENFIQHTSLYRDLKNPHQNPDFYQSLSFKCRGKDLIVRYDVPNISKLVSLYNPGNIKRALYYSAQPGQITAWEVTWKDCPTISRKLCGEKDGEMQKRGLKTALRHYILRMQTYEGGNPPIMVVFDASINFHEVLKPLVKKAEADFSLRPSIMLQCQEPYNG